jgi:Chondroitinase B
MESMVTEIPLPITEERIAGPRNGMTMEKIEQEINSKHLKPVTKNHEPIRDKNHITIENLDFTADDDGEQDGKQLNIIDCEEVTIQYCKFRKKTTEGQGLNIVGEKTKKVTVQYCIFEDFSFPGENGGEPLRLGESKYSGCIYEDVVVKNNIFRNLMSDWECISIKSAKTIIQDNFFIHNRGDVTVRQGGLAKIQHNYFRGTNGVRIHGYGNYVGYNCFEDNPASDDDPLCPITVRWGKENIDPNWVWVNEEKGISKPKGDEGSGNSIYAWTVDTVIEGNEFKNCNNTIIELKRPDDMDKRPKNTKDNNNKKVTKFSVET